MNIILVVVIIYTLTASGGLTKAEYRNKAETLEQCELAAKVVKVDKVLNSTSSYVFSAECEVTYEKQTKVRP